MVAVSGARFDGARGRRCRAPNLLAGDDDGVAIDDSGWADDVGGRRSRGESGDQQHERRRRRMRNSEGPMRRRGRETRPADAAAVEMLDEAGRAYPGFEAVSVRVGCPWRRCGRKAKSRISASVTRRISSSRSTASIRQQYGENGEEQWRWSRAAFAARGRDRHRAGALSCTLGGYSGARCWVNHSTAACEAVSNSST